MKQKEGKEDLGVQVMSKILIIGDMHFRLEKPYGSLFKDGRKGEWEEIKTRIIEAAKDCDSVILLGDNFNLRHNNSEVIREFVEFLQAFGEKEVYVISGNHEKVGTRTALDFLKQLNHKNWIVMTEPSYIHGDGYGMTFIPYMTPATLGVETNEQGAQKLLEFAREHHTPGYAFCHHALSGKTSDGIDCSTFNEIVLPRDEVSKLFKKTLYGHIHTSEVSGNLIGTGSVPTQEVGEIEKFIWTLDTDTDEVEKIKLPCKGIYKAVITKKTFEKLDTVDIPEHSIVKAIVVEDGIELKDLEEKLQRFDAFMIVEQIPHRRQKVHFEEGKMDTSVEGLMKVYAEAKNINLSDLLEGLELIK
jgi:predicted phosphodiesterase